MIPVTKSFVPPLAEYAKYLEEIWDSAWLTNRGKLVLRLEEQLKEQLGINNFLLTTNGTIPLQIALKLLGDNSEVITTPFSYVASTSAIVWEGCQPVFVDIDPNYFSLDETKVEAAITKNTKAILATHVYGNPCDVQALQRIGAKHNLPIIYDGAHAFGVRYNGRALLDYGDVSTCSFHATKLFHTGEGGAIIAKDNELAHKIFYSHNFGHDGQVAFHGLGINGKMSELQAAMGLAVLPYFDMIIEERKKVVEAYNELLDFERLTKMKLREGTEWNYSYYPVLFESEFILNKVDTTLKQNEVFCRRYFYPSLNKLDYVTPQSSPVAEDISKRILCLPLYVGLKKEELEMISSVINNCLKSKSVFS